METVIVLGLFSVAVVIAADIFLMSNRAQRRSLNSEQIQSDGRYVMESIVREIRAGAIDYPWYETNRPLEEDAPTDVLAIIDGQGTRVRFFKSADSSDCTSSQSDSCLLVSINDEPAQVVTPRGVNVFGADFYVRPAVDPFFFDSSTGLNGADEMPRVTFTMAIESVTPFDRDRAVIYLQTTASSRNFRR